MLSYYLLVYTAYPSHVHLYHGVGAAHDQHQQVGDAEVEEEQVGGGPHRLGGQDDDEDEDVADDADGEDEAEEDEAGVGDVGREDPLLGLGLGGVGQQGEVLTELDDGGLLALHGLPPVSQSVSEGG